MIQVQLRGANKVQRFIKNLPKEINKEVNNETGEFMKDVKKSAKIRAPRKTGELAKSIILTKKGKQWILQINSPYGKYQEEGFKPHWAPIMGSRKMAPGVYFVSKSKPFMKPALEQNIGRLSQILSNRVVRALI